MKKITLLLLGLLLSVGVLMAQDAEPKAKERPVSGTFESGVIIDNQTILVPDKGTLEMVIEHRFGTIQNGTDDMFGLYAPSNIRMGLNYSIRDYLMIGIGATKDRKLYDVRVKWNIIHQTRSNNMPVAITLYGNLASDGRDKEVFGEAFEGQNRYSFFAQIIFARKFSDAISLQFAPSFSHINNVEPGLEHDKYGLSFSGRAKFSPQGSFIFNYDIPLHIKSTQEFLELGFKPKANLALGVEFATGTHVFQVYLGTADALSNQYNMMMNDNDWTNGDMMFGFTITRLWSF